MEAWQRFCTASGSYEDSKTKCTTYYLDADRVRLLFLMEDVSGADAKELYRELAEICQMMNEAF